MWKASTILRKLYLRYKRHTVTHNYVHMFTHSTLYSDCDYCTYILDSITQLCTCAYVCMCAHMYI